MTPLKRLRLGHEELAIYPDLDPESPREWDNLGTMICFHRRYALGDNKHGIKHEDFESWNAIETFLWSKRDAIIVLPLYLYDHSGLRIKVGSFHGLLPQGHAEFDSGQIGFIYVDRTTVRAEYGVRRITKRIREQAETVLRGEVETYDQYLRGDIWGYVYSVFIKCELCNHEERNELDSCWGFFGVNALLDSVNGKWRDAFDQN